MAGSRMEKFGSIYSRVKGLLTSGALKESDRPLWLSIYERYPPRQEPIQDRPIPEVPVRNILYKEDVVRAKFYDQFGSVGVVDLTEQQEKIMSQRFIDRHQELEKSVHSEDIFTATVHSLKAEGHSLRTLEEIQKEKKERIQARIHQSRTENETVSETKPNRTITASELFGKNVVKDEEEDF